MRLITKNQDVMERFYEHIVVDSGCWRWRCVSKRTGYGNFMISAQLMLAHRFSYLLFNGNLVEGLQIDHLCRNKACVNPQHLEQVSREENMLRSVRARTHCKWGHEFTENNTYMRKKGKGRICKTCAARRNGYAHDY